MFSKVRVIGKLPRLDFDTAILRQFCTVKDVTATAEVNNGNQATVGQDNVAEAFNQTPIDEHSLKPDIVDINMDAMMEDDSDFGETMNIKQNNNMQPEGPTISSKDIDGAHIAPVDINPWMDEEEMAEGTVDMERIEREQKPIEYPPLPEKREATTYKFKGIQIRLPSSMLTKATYRYRLDQEDEGLADDIRICKFT